MSYFVDILPVILLWFVLCCILLVVYTILEREREAWRIQRIRKMDSRLVASNLTIAYFQDKDPDSPRTYFDDVKEVYFNFLSDLGGLEEDD